MVQLLSHTRQGRQLWCMNNHMQRALIAEKERKKREGQKQQGNITLKEVSCTSDIWKVQLCEGQFISILKLIISMKCPSDPYL